MIPVERSHLTVAAISHPGMSGKNNEDRYAVSAYRLETEASIPAAFAIVADGIGGHRAGEVAAEMAVETISQVVAASDASQPLQTLHEAIVYAGQLIALEADAKPEQKGMGSTCACAWIIGAQLFIATVGDSRIYLVRGDEIHQLTTDHTWVQEAIDQGFLKPDKARDHPNAHVIRRYLGSKGDAVPDLRLHLNRDESEASALGNQGMALQSGDLLLLCSDGLTDLVEDREILETLQTRSPQEALQELVRLCNRRGGHDNITIVTLGVPAVGKATVPIVERQKRSRVIALAAAAGLLAVIGLLVGAGLIWMWRGSGSGADATARPFQEERATLFPDFGRTELPGVTQDAGSVSGTATPRPTTGTIQPAPGGTLPAGGLPQPTLTPWPTNTTGP